MQVMLFANHFGHDGGDALPSLYGVYVGSLHTRRPIQMECRSPPCCFIDSDGLEELLLNE